MVSRSILLHLPPPHQTMRQRPGWTIVRKMRTCQTLTLRMSGINPPRFSRWVNTVFPAVTMLATKVVLSSRKMASTTGGLEPEPSKKEW